LAPAPFLRAPHMIVKTRLETLRLEEIHVGERFRKDYGDLGELTESIRAKGLIQPLTVDLENNLLAGGRRLDAARAAELESVPVIRRAISDKTDALEIELFENIHRKDFTWPERAALERALLNHKKEMDPNWTQAEQARQTQASPAAVSRRIELANAIEAFPELAGARTEDEAWKTYKRLEERMITESLVNQAKAVALKGMKIAESNYKVGDVLDGLTRLADGAYGFAEVDPPYGVDLGSRKGRNKQDNFGDYQEIPAAEYMPFIGEVASEIFRVTAKHSFIIWWFGMSWYTPLVATLREVGFLVGDMPALWYKGNQGQTASPDTMLGSCYEPFLVCRKGDAKLARPGRSNVFYYNPLPPSQKIHPTEKPLDLMTDIVETFSYPGSWMVIPFLGSGVTLRACYATGRIGFGWDLSEEFRARFLGKVFEDEEAKLYEQKTLGPAKQNAAD